MANLIGQCTIPAGGKVQLSTGIQLPSNNSGGIGAAPSQNGNIFVQQLIVQNNQAHNMRLGDVTVSSTKGLLLLANGGSFNGGAFINYGTYLSDWWINGTSGDVVDFIYIQ